jgi:hypothetical protein
VVAVSVLAFVFQSATLRVALAQMWGESEDPTVGARALRLDPLNPELHYQMGMLNLTKLEDASAALIELRRAVELNPRPARYWLAIGRLCFLLGDQGCATQAFERAVREAPMQPSLEWQAVSYYAVTGDDGRMFAHARRLLELNPDSAYDLFALMWRSSVESNPFTEGAQETKSGDYRSGGSVPSAPSAVKGFALWAEVVSRSSKAAVKCAYLGFLAEKNEFNLAAQYWKETALSLATANSEIVTRQEPATRNSQLAFSSVKPYLQRLMWAQRYSEAVTVWQDMLRLGLVQSGNWKPEAGNLVFNGSFEQPILNAGFDWQTRELQYVALDLADSNVERGIESGRRALRINFAVAHNANDEPLFQLVPVAANQQYQLTARVRSEGITSDSGPRLRVQDSQCPSCLDVATETTVGTTDWHQVALTFVTSPATHVVCISVWRPRSRVFPMDITGRFWLDNVSLRPTP